jgi:ParB family chromosome partitioning protein
MAGGKETKDGAKAKRPRRRVKAVEAASRGLTAAQVGSGTPPAKVEALRRAIEEDGGAVLGVYRDPIGGHWQLLAGLPIGKVAPTPFQRDLSDAHVARLAGVIDRMDRFVDPIVAVRAEDGSGYWTPNGHHRTAAVRAIGGRAIVALVLPDAEVAYKILALNTEKAHNLREKALEVIRMARTLAAADPRPEKEFALEFEEPAYVTLGLCYEQNGRFAGGAYHPVLKRVDTFLDARLPRALEVREERAARLLELDEAVGAAVKALKARGFESPYLRAFVVARVNPLRFQRGAKGSFDETIGKMISAARRFDPAKVRADQLAATGGPPGE